MKILKNPFAMRNSDHRIITINDLSSDQRGAACDCICPACKQHLLAKMGDIRIHHFAHADHSCDFYRMIMSSLYLILFQGLKDAPFTFPAPPKQQKKNCHIGDAILPPKIELLYTEICEDDRHIPQALIAIAENKKTKEFRKVALVIEPPFSLFKKSIAFQCPDEIKESAEGVLKIIFPKNYDFYSNPLEAIRQFLLNDTAYKSWVKNRKLGIG